MMRKTSFFRLRQSLRDALAALLLALTLVSLVGMPAPAMDLPKSGPSDRQKLAQWREPLPPDQKIDHLLNRITFGPRPGDVERVRETGIQAFIDEQLHPERIDDSALEAKLGTLPTLAMTSQQLFQKFGPPPLVQQQALARRAGALRAQQPSSVKEQQAIVGSPQPPDPSGQQPKAAAPPVVPPGGVVAMSPARGGIEPQPGKGMMAIQGPQRIIMELGQEELWRAVYSNRQLQEVMVQFWMNHFNIFVQKGADRWLLTSFERDAIRPYALGKFEDLLEATAQSPAMLFYLDNWMSVTPSPTYRPGRQGAAVRPNWGPGGVGGLGRGGFMRWPFGHRALVIPAPVGPKSAPSQTPRQGQMAPQRPAQRRGLNENYARELMELHTLGVDGGYTQHDVIEVARCFTGWTIDRPQQGGGFIFRPQMHDYGQKVVLRHKIHKGRGMEDGLTVLHLLVHSPSTAHFISLKLCRRFIADDPPESVVRRATQAFMRTGGDIRAVLKSILTSPEFYSQAAFRAKVKSPFELVASSLRALGGETDAGAPILFGLARMGQPMFQYEAPTGFPDRAATWINSGSLLARINFAMMLAANRVPGTHVDLKPLEEGAVPPERLLDEFSTRLIGGTLAAETRNAILMKVETANAAASGANPQRDVATIAGLVLASPEFQRR